MIDPRQPDFSNTPASPQRPPFDYAPADPGALPGVTIVTPFFNTGSVFHETARCVFQQSFQQWEWLIVDDASTDAEARTVLASYEDVDPRVRVLHHEANRGPGAARNTGFAQARAPYVVQLDSDDLIEPTAIEEWLWFLDGHPQYGFVKGYVVGFGAQHYLWRRGFHEGRAFLRENLVSLNAMIRTAVHGDVGGYDESNRDGLEDWDFWLRCANAGHWGDTIPQYLDWYRRRPSHNDRWANWDNGPANRSFQHALRRRYPHLWNGGFPQPAAPKQIPQLQLREDAPYPNRLRKTKPRLLFVVPWLAMGGADKFNLDVVRELTRRGWEITIATTLQGDYSWLPRFTSLTPDVFAMPAFLPVRDYPRFLRYLIESRDVDLVMISNSEFAHRVLPYLRSRCPTVPFVDYCHMEEEHWNDGGHPRVAVDYHTLLDLNLVSSEHLKQWMVARGAAPDRVRVCSTNVDTDFWRPDAETRRRVRQRLGVGEDVPLVLYCGRICDQKQPQVFARTMRALASRGARFAAVVAGDGPDEPWLREYVSHPSLQHHVRMLGAVPNDQVRELLQAADIFFLPSRWEGIALSIFEAMACGVAVVGADVGGQRELVTPDCGILLTPADPNTEAERYAAAIGALFADPARRADMGTRARQRVESSFQLHQMAERLLSLFEEATRLASTSPRTIPHPELARVIATQTVQYFRLASAFDSLRQEESDRRKRGVSWRARTYFGVQRLLLPAYRKAVEHDARWVVPLKNRLKRALLRTTDEPM
jgi:glycosyltransferase involved in cell wall biosynthesis